jgi:hypothetical protein
MGLWMDEKDGVWWFLATESRGETGCRFREKAGGLLLPGSWDLSQPLRAVASKREQQRYPKHPSLLTYGTKGDIDPTDSEQLLLPGLLFGVLFGYGFSFSEDLTT